MCLMQAAPGQLRGELVRMCSCRGPHAGFVHIRCLVKNAEERGEYDDEAYTKALITCTQCRQDFRGPVRVALKRAAWLRYVGRAETDKWRQTALRNLGVALHNVHRIDEALVIKEERLAMMRRLYGPNDGRTIHAEEAVAVTLKKDDGEENLQRALKTLTRTYAWKVRTLKDHENTFDTAGHLADCQRLLGMFKEAEALYRTTLAARQRVLGKDHLYTFYCEAMLACCLRDRGKFKEARAMYDTLLPRVRRVLGPSHNLTRSLLEDPM